MWLGTHVSQILHAWGVRSVMGHLAVSICTRVFLHVCTYVCIHLYMFPAVFLSVDLFSGVSGIPGRAGQETGSVSPPPPPQRGGGGTTDRPSPTCDTDTPNVLPVQHPRYSHHASNYVQLRPHTTTPAPRPRTGSRRGWPRPLM